LPYCLKANLILADIWRETGRDEAGLYWRRAQALDPENRVAHELLGTSAGPVQEVMVPLLEFGAETEAERPVWMEEVAISGTSEVGAVLVDVESALRPKIEIPAWLEAMEEDSAEAEAVSAAGLTGELVDGVAADEVLESEDVDLTETGEVEIAEWRAEEASVEVDSEGVISDDVPAWISSLVMESSDTDGMAVPETEEESEWLPVADSTDATVTDLPESDVVVDWLSDQSPEDVEAEVPGWISELTQHDEPLAEGISDAVPEEDVEGAPLEAAEVPAWLSELAPPEESLLEDDLSEGTPQTDVEGAFLEAAEVPAWLSELARSDEPVVERKLDVADDAGVDVVEEEAAEMPGWLAGLTQGDAVVSLESEEEELEVSTMASESEAAEPEPADIPPWLVSLRPEEEFLAEDVDVAESSEESAVEAFAEAERAEIASDIATPEMMEPAVGDIPAWLSGLTEEPEEADEAPATPEDVPEWLAETQLQSVPEAVSPDKDIVTDLPEWLQEDGVPSGDQALAWLEQLAAGKEEELQAQMAADGEARMSEIMGRTDPGVVDVIPAEAATPAEDVPGGAPVTASAVVDETDKELPSWLMGDALPSGDEALAWLEQLAAGKEDELQAQMVADGESRIAVIMGAVETEVSPPGQDEAPAADTLANEVAEEELRGTGPEGPGWLSEDRLPSGGEALAWLEQLAEGKEDELQVQMEAEGDARMAEIMGRSEPEAAVPELEAESAGAIDEVVETLPVEVELATEPAPVSDVLAVDVSEAAPEAEVPEIETVEPELQAVESAFGWTSIGTEGEPVAVDSMVEDVGALTEVEETLAEPGVELSDTQPMMLAEELPDSESMPPEDISDGLASEELAAPEVMSEELMPKEPMPAGVMPAEVISPDLDISAVESPADVRLDTAHPEEDAEPAAATVAAAEASEVEKQAAEIPPGADKFADERSRVASNPRDYDAWLVLARGLHGTGDQEESMAAYERLIKAGKQLNEVVVDLEVLASQSSSVQVMRMLGDAYMKGGQLQEALDAYRTALNNL